MRQATTPVMTVPVVLGTDLKIQITQVTLLAWVVFQMEQVANTEVIAASPILFLFSIQHNQIPMLKVVCRLPEQP